MAIDKRLQVFDAEGNPVDYDILATDVKFQDGEDLPTKLAELEEEIGEGGYTPPEGGIPKTDLAPAVQQTLDDVANKVDKVNGKGLSTNDFTTALFEKLNALPNAAQYEEDIADAGKVKTVSVNNGTPATPDQNGNVNINVQAGDQVSVIQPDPADGTFTIRVGSTDYTINLNHTHENMAKLVVDTAANLPDASKMESDTIYGELDDGEIATIYLGGYPFYGGGGGASSGPVLRRPVDGATIDMGQTTSGTVSKAINIKGKSLTQALTIQLSGTGYSFGTTQPSGVTRDSSTQLTVTAAAANTLNGVDIVVVYTGSDTDEDASGTLGITSNDNISVEVTLVANKVTYENLAGVKLTGTQWLQTDYNVVANTKVSMRLKFTENANTIAGDNSNTNYYFLTAYTLSSASKQFAFYAYKRSSTESQLIAIVPTTPPTVMNIPTSTFLTDDSLFEVGLRSMKFTPNGGTAITQSIGATQAMDKGPLTIGLYHSSSGTDSIFNWYDLTIYELTITENDVVKRHYTPVAKNGVPGLLDSETGHFMSSKTSAELVAIPLT